MKFTLNWLKDHLETNAGLDEILKTLTLIGLEVEEVKDPGETLKDFVIARIENAEKHPDADKLQVCTVNNGKETVQVVCGAPNARTGLIGVFAPVGTYVPGIDFTLKKAKIRGVESFGMLCSESELELSNDHEGIIELEATAAKSLGEKFIDHQGLNDPVIEIAITPNRPDCLGVRGIARDLAAAGLGTLKKEGKGFEGKGDYKSDIKIKLDFKKDDTHICPAFWGRQITGVKNGPSPAWLQQRLRAIGLRPINALVDITNYISYDRARPLHVYDADKLNGTVSARLGKKGEAFQALDGNNYDELEGACVIADEKNVLGLGGVIGGENEGSTETTTNVLIESAYFDPISIAMTGRRLNINSDARYRFERGIDPLSVETGVNLAAKMILDICGGEASELIKAGNPKAPEKPISFNPDEVVRLTGIELGTKAITRILKALGFKLSPKGNAQNVEAPSWRPDIHGSADLVEEVIRIEGLDKITPTPLPRLNGIARPVLTTKQLRVRTARRALAARGALEAITWSFIRENEAQNFGGGSPELKLANPISTDMSDMRPSLLPGLLNAARQNLARGQAGPVLMEVGEIYHSDEETGQRISATLIRTGNSTHEGGGRHWLKDGEPVTVFDAKADALALLGEFGLSERQLQILPEAPAWYHPGRSGVMRLGPKNLIAVFGELHPEVTRLMDLDGPVVACEIDLDAIPERRAKTLSKGAMEITDLQPLTRDFAFVLEKDIPAGTLIRAAHGADKSLITNVTLFDHFEGESLGPDKKSLAIEVTLQPKDKTLTDEEIDEVADKIIKAVNKTTGGEIRG